MSGAKWTWLWSGDGDHCVRDGPASFICCRAFALILCVCVCVCVCVGECGCVCVCVFICVCDYLQSQMTARANNKN